MLVPWRALNGRHLSAAQCARGPACHIGGNVGEGGFPPTKRPQYLRHSDAENVPASLSLSPLVPDIPQTGSSTGLRRYGRPSSKSAVPTQGRGCPTPSLLCRLPMLRYHVSRHQSNCHLLPTLLTLHPYLLPLPVGRALPRHSSPARHLRLVPCRLKWMADHSDCLPKIGPHDHPIEQANQGDKCALEP